ncbi:aminoglycoside phosphotransferase family protein [Blastococcus sp. TBT05-19]|uniref:phosphotransferase n=1 Tax=Blastococcus sp. TBT05-19 TaxID=2250581 RepID=UPI000DE83223|nr:phosphotransferase [Blastococcus sp. TBT05-19]RBY89132.1 aminoglycoside phosphotransferase family protein [Blastococcus sp. TBT05-19]
MTTTGVRTWQDADWRSAALAWALEQLDRAGLVSDGEPEQPHVRSWSTAFRLPLRGGDSVWLKSVGSGSAQEPVLAGALGRWVPEHVLVPLAVEPARRLLLMPDGGRTLREAGSGDLAAWEAMLVDHARLQVAVAPHADELVGLGVPDHRPERLPGLVADLLADDDALEVGRPDAIAPEVRERVVVDLGAYARACRELADGSVPASVQHDDLHDANVFVADGRHRFFDWGDASVSHPFLVLLVTLRFAARVLDLPDGDPALVRLRDAYLDQWLDFGTVAELRQLCDLALRVGPLQRALTWRRILRGVHPEERVEWAGSVPGWTAEHLAPSPLHAGA